MDGNNVRLWGEVVMSGLVTMTPDECSCWGGNIWITDNGGVRFENADKVVLDGVFTPDYDNYVVMINTDEKGSYTFALNVISGTYTTQMLLNRSADNAVLGRRDPSEDATASHVRNMCLLHVYGPHLPGATAGRTVGALIDMKDAAFTTPAGSATGFTLTATAERTGNLIVMGYAE
jgi:hypothetical protein